MHIAVLTLGLHLEGCTSLKEKRQRVGGLRDRFGRLPGVAVCESGAQNEHQRAEWSFVVAAATRSLVDRQIAEIERFVTESVDARIGERSLDYL